MTVSMQEKIQLKIDKLESLRAWFVNHTSSVSTYGSSDAYQPKTFDDIIADLAKEDMTVDSLFSLGYLTDDKVSLMAVTVRGIYEELKNITKQDTHHPLTQIFTHIHQYKASVTDAVKDYVNTLFECQINAHRGTLTMLQRVTQKTETVVVNPIKDTQTPKQKSSYGACFKRYFCCCFNFYKSAKYQGTNSTDGENTSLLQKTPVTTSTKVKHSDFPDTVTL